VDILHIALGLVLVGFSFGFIIFIHEMGHFLAARSVGIRCPQFAIGFGPALISFRRRGTEFALRAFPIGGYVLMVGEDPNADPTDSWHSTVSTVLNGVEYPTTPAKILEDWSSLEDRAKGDPTLDPSQTFFVREHLESLKPDEIYSSQLQLEGNFNHKTIPQRMLVILGGVIMNFIAATILMWGLGFTVGLGGIERDSKAFVSDVIPGGAAQRAGIQPGDVITQIDALPIVSGGAMIRAIAQHPAQEMEMDLLRAGKTQHLKIVPDFYIGGVGGIWIASNSKTAELGLIPETSKARYQELGAQQGDVIVGVNGTAVTKPADLAQAVKAYLESQPASQKIELKLERKGKEPLKLSGTLQELLPVGKIGIAPAAVASIGFVKTTTSEITAVTPKSPAEQVGLLPGDTLLTVDEQNVFSGESLERVLVELSKAPPTHRSPIDVARDRKFVQLSTKGPTPLTVSEFGLELKKVTTSDIFWSPYYPIANSIMMPVNLVQGFIKGALTAKTLGRETQGPLSMMRMIYQASDQGWAALIFFVAFLNAAIGGFNLIPFPALDGSRFLILAIGLVRGKEVDPNKEMIFHLAGMVMLLSLVALVSMQDIYRWWLGTPLMK
jgi:membrane-associated protease RseP (regulator of RpoE activity)